MKQMSLFDETTKRFPLGIKDHHLFEDIQPHIRVRFWTYHLENPHILDLFIKYARLAKQAGYKKYGVGSIQERIRWHLDVETRGDQFKINNNYRSCYGRLVSILLPDEFKDFFEFRSPSKRKELC